MDQESPDEQRPTWAEIHLNNLAFNLRSVRNFLGNSVDVLAVVKANAYGHGALRCSQRLEAEGIQWFGVAIPEEAVELRKGGIRGQILCMGGFWPGQEHLILQHDITPVVYRIDAARSLNDAAQAFGRSQRVHIKIDTGMGRIGLRYDEVESFLDELKEFRALSVEGLMTHFAAADDLGQNAFTALQSERLYDALSKFKAAGFDPSIVDLANSPGAIAHREYKGDLIRLGGVLYGLGGDVLPREIPIPELKPVLSLHSRIAHIKNVPAGESLGYGRTFSTSRHSMIATVPIGYDDGYQRSLSNNSRVIVNGRYAPVVGRISMDWTIVDVTDVPNAAVGDAVLLIGLDKSGLSIFAEELAAASKTISYEITCGISSRVPRIFLQSDDT